MKTYRGFTVVELLVVIIVIVMLTTITVLGFGEWRGRTARTEMKHELTTVASAIENYRNFNNENFGTPGVRTTILTGLTYRANKNVSITYTLRMVGDSYCIKATSVAVPSEKPWYIDSAKGNTPSDIECS